MALSRVKMWVTTSYRSFLQIVTGIEERKPLQSSVRGGIGEGRRGGGRGLSRSLTNGWEGEQEIERRREALNEAIGRSVGRRGGIKGKEEKPSLLSFSPSSHSVRAAIKRNLRRGKEKEEGEEKRVTK